MVYDVAILGAGASGIMVDTRLQDQNICIIEANDKIGAKIRVSGGGKCNITNKYLKTSNFLGDQEFIQAIFDKFDNDDLLKYLYENNLYPNLNEKIVKGTYFCNSSNDVISLFKKLTSNIHFKLNTKVEDVEYKNDLYSLTTNKNTIQSKKLIIASGGKSFPALGASEIGYEIAKKFGHTINRLDPALVGFTVQKDQFWFKELSGLSLDVRITIENKTIEGNMLFTHKGCSGPVILTASLYWKKGKISINFLPSKSDYSPKRFKKLLKN